jgi:hypothetical protein
MLRRLLSWAVVGPMSDLPRVMSPAHRGHKLLDSRLAMMRCSRSVAALTPATVRGLGRGGRACFGIPSSSASRATSPWTSTAVASSAPSAASPLRRAGGGTAAVISTATSPVKGTGRGRLSPVSPRAEQAAAPKWRCCELERVLRAGRAASSESEHRQRSTLAWTPPVAQQTDECRLGDAPARVKAHSTRCRDWYGPCEHLASASRATSPRDGVTLHSTQTSAAELCCAVC